MRVPSIVRKQLPHEGLGRVAARALLFALAALLCLGSVCAQQVVTVAGTASSTLQAGMPVNPSATTVNGTTAPYALRPGDSVNVAYRFTPEFDDTEVIAPDGHIALKNIGQVQAAGLSLVELQARILDVSRAQLVNPEVTVSLRDFEHSRVVVAGEVVYPGRIELRRPTTALEAILLAGGPKQGSAMGHVYVFRRLTSDTAETHVLNLRKLRTGDRTRHDLLLQPDDMILIRRDALSTVERYMKLVNLGVYFNPLGNNGLF